MLVLETVALAVGVTDKLIVDVEESVPLSVPLNDGNAPTVTEDVGD